jgi:hypothetical protein
MQAAGMDIPQRVFTWFYRRLGRRYPALFMAVELQTAWFITIGLLALLNLYYDAPHSDLLLVLGITLGLTGLTVTVAFLRALGYLRPLAAWIESDRQDTGLAAQAWETAVGLPLEVVRRDMKLPVFWVAIPGSLAGVIVLGLSPFAFFPIFAAALVAIGYSGILHYFAIEAGMRIDGTIVDTVPRGVDTPAATVDLDRGGELHQPRWQADCQTPQMTGIAFAVPLFVPLPNRDAHLVGQTDPFGELPR